MKITKEMLNALEKAVKIDLEDAAVKKLEAEDLLEGLLEEARRVHKTNDKFSEPLARSIVGSLPWHLQSFKLFSEIPRY